MKLPEKKRAASPDPAGEETTGSAFATPPAATPPAAEQPAAEQPAVEQPAVEQPAVEAQAPDAAPAETRPGDVIRKLQEPILPSQREYDPTPEGLRIDREKRENWESQRHQRKKLEFGTKLTSTEDENVKADPNAPPEMRRKKFIGGTSESADSGPAWDDDSPQRGRGGKLSMMILVLALVMIAAIALLGLGLLDNDAAPQLADTTQVQKAYGLLEQSADASEFAGEVLEVTRKFLEAQSVDELVGYIRQPERVTPLLRQYYSVEDYVPAAYKRLPEPRELMSHQKYIVAVVELEGRKAADGIGDVEQQRIIALEQTPEGFRVDWESWVGYSEISWDLFTSQRMTDPYEFRAMVGRDDYYNYKYQDFIDWRCYQVRDPGESFRLWGYAPRNGEVDKQLQRALLRSPYTFAILRLRYPADNSLDAESKQVEIVGLLEEGWVKRDDNDLKVEDEMLDGSFDFK